jgi:hypothetical protein
MKKNLLSKISSSAVMITACLALITIVLPFGKIAMDESGVNYDSEVNTLCDDEFEPMNHI